MRGEECTTVNDKHRTKLEDRNSHGKSHGVMKRITLECFIKVMQKYYLYIFEVSSLALSMCVCTVIAYSV